MIVQFYDYNEIVIVTFSPRAEATHVWSGKSDLCLPWIPKFQLQWAYFQVFIDMYYFSVFKGGVAVKKPNKSELVFAVFNLIFI